MPLFAVQHAYAASRDGQRLGPWAKGDEVELDADVAAFVEVDSPGALAPVKAEPKAAKPNRQHQSAKNRDA